MVLFHPSVRSKRVPPVRGMDVGASVSGHSANAIGIVLAARAERVREVNRGRDVDVAKQAFARMDNAIAALKMKIGQTRYVFGLFGKLVAGTGFEPVTFGL